MTITNDQEHDLAIEQLITWNQAPDAAARRAEIIALGESVEAYEEAAGHTPNPPSTLRGILQVEMFKRQIRERELAQLLEIPEPSLSALLEGTGEMNLDFARRLYQKLQIPADTIFSIAA